MDGLQSGWKSKHNYYIGNQTYRSLTGRTPNSTSMLTTAPATWGPQTLVYFSIDSRAPTIVLMQPANQSYDSTDVQLMFTIDETNATLSYSLDGQPNILIIGNMSLVALSNGAHRVTVFATDNLGNKPKKQFTLT